VKCPAYLVVEDARAACLYRHYGLPPENYRLKVIELFGGLCVCCGEDHTELMTIDHIKPLNGKRREARLWLRIWREQAIPENLQMLCAACNSDGKSNRPECSYRTIAPHIAHLLKEETQSIAS
jgi:5-methylcytosine-specific restriction endonuclease McrA